MKVGLKHFKDALFDYDKSIELNPQSATTYYARGMAKEKIQDFEGALNDYNKTLEIDSTFYMVSIRASFAKQDIKEMTGLLFHHKMVNNAKNYKLALAEIPFFADSVSFKFITHFLNQTMPV
jgi:tetratricopeptide (TPR) repeat protein